VVPTASNPPNTHTRTHSHALLCALVFMHTVGVHDSSEVKLGLWAAMSSQRLIVTTAFYCLFTACNLAACTHKDTCSQTRSLAENAETLRKRVYFRWTGPHWLKAFQNLHLSLYSIPAFSFVLQMKTKLIMKTNIWNYASVEHNTFVFHI